MDLDSLWPHQGDALAGCRSYVDAYRQGNTDGSALVRMPTGAGKSGVIAVLAAECVEAASCLVVTPWTALRDQIVRDIRRRFWEHMGVTPPDLRVEPFTPSSLGAILEDGTAAVLACTHATLQAVHRTDSKLFSRLRGILGLVLVDEGHREPAPSWALAVRSLRLPCVLFSATPYRNDQKLFKVDPAHTSTLSFQDAVEGGYIRSVEFTDPPPASDPDAFVVQLTAVVADLGDPEPRVIVRCANAAEIAAITKRLRAQGATAIGVHERFSSDGPPFLRRTVPDPESEGSQYWVHQFKLIEGIDDPRFAVLGVFSPLGSARAFVQQVGRVIRNPSREVGERATVLANRSQRRHWEGYLSYEQVSEDEEGLGSAIVSLQKYLESQASLTYYSGTFRRPFDPSIADVQDELRYRCSANVFDLTEKIELDTWENQLEAEFYTIDRHVLRLREIDEDTFLLIWIVVQNSPVLRSRLFFEYRLGYTLLHMSADRLFVSDSDGRVPEAVRAAGRPLPSPTLENLFPSGSRLGAVSLMNTDLGPNSVRRRTLHARSISDTAPNLFDHAFFPSTAWGYAYTGDGGERISRYVGFTRSRVSDSSQEEVTLPELLEWMDQLAESLESHSDGELPQAFLRYAIEAGDPGDPEPANILLDLGEIQEALVPLSGDMGPTELDDLCYDVAGGSFCVRLSGRSIDARIRFEAEKMRYVIESPELDSLLGVSLAGSARPTEPLTAYLNREQSFRIVTMDRVAIYAHSKFYAPRVPLGGPTADRIDLLRVFHSIPALEGMTSEKGDAEQPNQRGWAEDSVFGLIDNLGLGTDMHQLMCGADVLVCDDAGSAEVADFLLGDEDESRVALIHAKAGEGRRRSATVFQELVGQALKNLEYLSPFLDREPPNYRRWGEPWRANGIQVRHRVRRGGNRLRAWRRLRSLIRDPSATREVWLVLGAGFSAGEFGARVGRRTQPPEDVQILYLLSSLWSGVAAVGAQLRIFCSP